MQRCLPVFRFAPLLALASLSGLVGVAFVPSEAAACSCAWDDASAARERATHVFEGVLVRSIPASDGTPERLVFAVERVWKGEVRGTIHVAGTVGLTMCPPHLEVGERYIIYTGGPVDAPRIETCARYGSGAFLAAERRELGAPTRTYPARGR